MHAYNMSSNVSFLDLPGEIRNMVYRHALINEEPIRPHQKYSNLALGLIRASSVISREARSIVYREAIAEVWTNMIVLI
jgi:hypothetical protein